MKIFSGVAFFILLPLAFSARAEPRLAMREGTKAFEQGQFTNAIARFDAAAEEAPAAQLDPGPARFNRGVALFHTHQWDAAYEAFSAAQKTADMKLQGIALYNAGVTRMKQVADALTSGSGTNLETHLTEAIELFGRSLLVYPNQPDTRTNLELALAQRAALQRAILSLQQALTNADQLIAAHEFSKANALLTNARQQLAPVLALGRPEAKTFEQYVERTGQIVEILTRSTNNPPALSP